MLGPSPLDGFNLSKGYFYAPTIIEDISPEDEIWKEEIFGPVVVVKRFSVRPILDEEIAASLTYLDK